MSGALELSRAVYDKLAAASTVLPPRVRAWNGQVWGPESAPATLVLNHPGALRALLLPPTELTAGEAYVFGDVDVEGDLLAVLEFVATLRHLVWDRRAALGIVRMCRRLPAESRRREAVRPRMRGRLHSLGRDRQAVRHHYDTGNEFFAQFLGPAMVYSCAYFLGPEDTLAEAQVRKLDVICRKLQLQPGGRFLDVGCGWGGLVIHAARHYGVEAVGVTLSPEQASYARIRAKEEGVEEQVMVLEQDYREVEGRFDAVASVGMFEHVGRPRLSPYFESLHRLMAPGGSLLNHGITTRDRSSRRHPSFLRTYVFPDSELVPVEMVVEAAERAGFELRDAESLRPSYARTLRHWVANLEHNREAAIAAAGERAYRIWRLYMAGSALGFEQGGLGVYQLLLADPARAWSAGRRWASAADDA